MEVDYQIDMTCATSSRANCNKSVVVTLFIPGQASISSCWSVKIWASGIKWWIQVTLESVRGAKNWPKSCLSTFWGWWSRLLSQSSSFGYTAGLLWMMGMDEDFNRFRGENEWEQEWERECECFDEWFLRSSMSSSSFINTGAAAEVEAVFDCFVNAWTDGCCSICKEPGGFSRVACPEVYEKWDVAWHTWKWGHELSLLTKHQYQRVRWPCDWCRT